jgi:hypothetical protein
MHYRADAHMALAGLVASAWRIAESNWKAAPPPNRRACVGREDGFEGLLRLLAHGTYVAVEGAACFSTMSTSLSAHTFVSLPYEPCRNTSQFLTGYGAEPPPAPALRGAGKGRWRQMRQTTAPEVRLDEGKTTSSSTARRATDDLASNRGSCDRISMRRASMRWKIALNNQGICRMSV